MTRCLQWFAAGSHKCVWPLTQAAGSCRRSPSWGPDVGPLPSSLVGAWWEPASPRPGECLWFFPAIGSLNGVAPGHSSLGDCGFRSPSWPVSLSLETQADPLGSLSMPPPQARLPPRPSPILRAPVLTRLSSRTGISITTTSSTWGPTASRGCTTWRLCECWESWRGVAEGKRQDWAAGTWPFSGVLLPVGSFLLQGVGCAPGSSGWHCPQRDQNNEILDRNGPARRMRILSLEVEGLGWGGAGLAAVTPPAPPPPWESGCWEGGSPAALTRGKPGRRRQFSAQAVDSGKATLFTHHRPGIQLRSEGTQALSTSSAVPWPPQSGLDAPP